MNPVDWLPTTQIETPVDITSVFYIHSPVTNKYYRGGRWTDSLKTAKVYRNRGHANNAVRYLYNRQKQKRCINLWLQKVVIVEYALRTVLKATHIPNVMLEKAD